MVWNGSAFVRRAGTPLEIVWPKEGGIFWMDSPPFRPMRATSRGAEADRLPAAAGNRGAGGGNHRLSDAEPAAKKLLSPEIANDKSLYPDKAVIEHGEWQNDVGDASTLYESYFQKLKAGR